MTLNQEKQLSETVMSEVLKEVKALQAVLRERGWTVVNGPGDMASQDGITWFSVGYTHGEYTVSAWGRNRGAGPAQAMVRVRLTSPAVASNPGVGEVLGKALADTAYHVSPNAFPGDDVTWPPAAWAELALTY